MANIHHLLPDSGSRIGPGLTAVARFDTLAVAADDYATCHIAVLNMDGSVHNQLDGVRSATWEVSLDGTFALATVRFGQSFVEWGDQDQGVADGAAVAIRWQWFDAGGTNKWSETSGADFIFDPYTGLPFLMAFNTDMLEAILNAVRKTY